MRQLGPLVGVLALAPAIGSPRPVSAESTGARTALYQQSAAELLRREFHSPEVSFLLLDARIGTLLASQWDNPEQPIPLGSLVKPFVALAYGEAHQFHYPNHVCKGEAGGCWLPRGHGEIGLTSAIANSCNSYFHMLTANMRSADLIPAVKSFGLDSPTSEMSGPDLFGVGNRWLISPMRMARAYVELNRRRDQLGAIEVVDGMAQSARRGTGLEVDRALRHSAALVKTGTAACTHSVHAPGDGFVIALVPAEQPELLLMVRVHGVPGARAAATAGHMLSRIEQ